MPTAPVSSVQRSYPTLLEVLVSRPTPHPTLYCLNVCSATDKNEGKTKLDTCNNRDKAEAIDAGRSLKGAFN